MAPNSPAMGIKCVDANVTAFWGDRLDDKRRTRGFFVTGQNSGPSHWSGMADKLRQPWDGRCLGDTEAIAEIIPKADGVLGAGFHEPEERIAAVAPGIGSVPAEILRHVT